MFFGERKSFRSLFKLCSIRYLCRHFIKKIFLYIGPSISISKDGSPLSVLLNVNKNFFSNQHFLNRGCPFQRLKLVLSEKCCRFVLLRFYLINCNLRYFSAKTEFNGKSEFLLSSELGTWEFQLGQPPYYLLQAHYYLSMKQTQIRQTI